MLIKLQRHDIFYIEYSNLTLRKCLERHSLCPPLLPDASKTSVLLLQ